MWNLGNRASVVLISLTFGCVLVYNAWGAILALAVTLLVVVYVSYSLLINDSVVSPHAYHLVGYLQEAIHEISTALRTAHGYGIGQVRMLWRNANRYYREHFSLRMDRRRSYQLSSDSYAAVSAAVKRRDSSSSSTSSTMSTRFGLLDQFSPIPRVSNHRRLRASDILMTDERFHHASDYEHLSHQKYPAISKHCTSTPVKSGNKEEDIRNGEANQTSQSYKISPRKFSTTYSQNHMLNHGENCTQFSLEGSPWSTNSGSKTRPRPGGVKTVQTVAGPLLASTRYNIDPKVYTDVSSPGLTTRLTKYATDAKSKLNYQSQYGTGQFPKVNLQANPIPLLNPKMGKIRMPVTVRVAPPDLAKYSSPERQKILTNICHIENKSPTSVVQVLKEISLKRTWTSTEDVSFDVAKKQKTDSFFSDRRETILEENKQKRSRDDSKSDEDLSPQNKSVRPAKRTKTRSCYDILNSLSSSIRGDVITTGIKRKAVDFSRSGTPDFEKHFKSVENAQCNNSSILQSQNLDTNRNKSEVEEIYSRPFVVSLASKKMDFPVVKGILKPSNVKLRINTKKASSMVDKTAKNMVETNNAETIVSTKSVPLTDKLFMRAEPKRNERLKELVEEPGNIKIKFTKDNVEEIKREDLRNMRQTNMKARLQSMFDAISGKAEKSINPHVVIQADDVTVITPPVTCFVPVTCVTLNSSTTTTNVNTTPISTAAIIPSGLFSTRPDTKTDAKQTIAFSLSNSTSPMQPNTSVMSTIKIKEGALAAKTVVTIDQTKVVSTTIASTIAKPEPQKITSSSTPSPISTFTFGKTTTEVTSTNSLPNFSTTTCISSTSAAIPTISTVPTSTDLLTTDKIPLSSTFTSVPPRITSSEKIETSNIVATSATASSSITINTQANSTFTFGGSKLSLSPATSAQTSASSVTFQTTRPTSLIVNTTVATNIAGFNNSASNTSDSIATTTSATTSLFSFGSNSTTSHLPKSNMLTFGQSSNNTQSETNAFGSVHSNCTTTTTSATFKLPNVSTFPVSTSSTPSTSTLSTNNPLFVFGASTTSSITSAAAILPAAVSTSGTTDNFKTINNSVPIFGATTTTMPQFGASTTTASQFSTSTTSIFVTTSTTTSTTTTCIFGMTNNSQPLFGVASMTSPTTTSLFTNPNTTTPSIFTSTTNAVSSLNNTASSSLFSNVNASSTSTTTAPSLLFGSSSLIFGQTKPSTSFGSASTTGGIFGSTTTSLFSSTTQTTTASTFGITANVSTSTVTPGFNTTTPAFGSPSINTVTNAQTTPAFGGTSSIFGSTDNNASSGPVFSAFGTSSSTNTFGTPQSPATLTFGSGTSSSDTMFGDNKLPFEAAPTTTTGFGASNSSITAFGVSNTNNNNNTNSMFVFGSNQKEGQQNTSFSFGSNFNGNNNSTASSSVPFQFGSTSSKPASTGFNFTAPSVTPALNFGTSSTPTFNPSTPGMFSIGSGSTAPRSRTARTRKPR
ncbi:uncharacterized protein LOC109857140 isoform X2 [Pseudomyrmex gracilis]|uniref:uncharacterized protein LOC109857140 isoform X2 n=1 Tax=Pseudomyrmex gracilis TaxID=219809 RepID=UPI0009951D70|nr:uncharacterized protein LOC109857140 isoform X2 [Pseudomyrmex gracilis]